MNLKLIKINPYLSFILKLPKIDRIATIAIIFFSLLYIVLEAAIPFLVKELINSITIREINHILRISIIVILFYSLTRLFWTLSDYEVARLKIRVKGRLRQDLHAKLLRLPIDYFRHTTPGEIISKASSDVEIIGENSPLFPALLAAFVEIIVVLFVLLKLNVILTLITIATFPLYTIGEKNFKPKLEKSAEREREASDPVIESIRENVTGILTIKIFNSYKYFEKIFNSKVEEWAKASKYKARYFFTYWGLTGYIEHTLPLVILGIGSIMAAKNLVDLPTVIAFFTFVPRVYVPVWNINFLLTTIPGSYPSVRRILEIIEHKEEKIVKGASISELKKITFKNVSFSYGDKEVIKSLHLEIPSKSWIAVVGNTGSGKSTLCLLLAGLLKPTQGSILLNEESILNYDSIELRKNIIYVANKDFIFNDSIKNNLTLGDKYNDYEIQRISDICGISEFAPNLNINALNLSDGQKQRVAIARALLRNPLVLILDEATAAIDSRIEDLIFNNIKKEFPNITLFIVSHRLSTISKADQIAVMKEGEILCIGNHETLLKDCKHYKELFEKQIIIS